ncbi:MAG TPA: hypothetical protein VIU62_06125, partial [Chloroflexota bacterium]
LQQRDCLQTQVLSRRLDQADEQWTPARASYSRGNATSAEKQNDERYHHKQELFAARESPSSLA